RRIKCDEAQPICNRCHTARILCKGYNIRLRWKGLSGDSAALPSRNVPPNILTALTRAEVSSIQHDLDGVDSRTPFSSRGLFSVFCAQPVDSASTSLQSPHQSHSSLLTLSDDDVMPLYKDVDKVVGTCTENEIQPCNSPGSHEDNVDQPAYSTFPCNGVSPSHSSSIDCINSADGDGNNECLTPTSIEPLDDQPSPNKELIHHWVISLNSAMAPVARIDRPQHNMLMPLALAGMKCTFQESSAEIAVFHGICAASAFNLFLLRNDDAHYHRLAIRHRHLALCHLRNSIQGNNTANNESIWAAVLTFLFQEGIRGSAHEWRAHMRGLDSLVRANSHMIRNSLVARGVYESWLCITILGNLHTEVDLQSMLTEVPPTLDYIGSVHGLTRPILEMVLEINSLASLKPSPSPIELDRLELLLYLHFPVTSPAEGIGHRTLLQHYMFIYYYATIVHFQRFLRKKEPEAIQDVISTALGHLEAVETVGDKPKGCIWVWPCVVISSECATPELQGRMVSWYEQKRRHGFGNLQVACKLSSEVWRRRTEYVGSPGDVYWQDLINGMEYDVLPL
ncbi:hypothetical protein OIDMADRAFT_137459, partial [Oidiodendron maius Zn]